MSQIVVFAVLVDIILLQDIDKLWKEVVTLMTTNGQAPFVTVFMYLNEAKNEQEKKDPSAAHAGVAVAVPVFVNLVLEHDFFRNVIRNKALGRAFGRWPPLWIPAAKRFVSR